MKLRRGGRMKFEVVAVEPGRLLACESRFPGARYGQEHRIEPESGESVVSHRLYVEGPASGLWALMLGRKRLRGLAAELCEKESELLGSP